MQPITKTTDKRIVIETKLVKVEGFNLYHIRYGNFGHYCYQTESSDLTNSINKAKSFKGMDAVEYLNNSFKNRLFEGQWEYLKSRKEGVLLFKANHDFLEVKS